MLAFRLSTMTVNVLLLFLLESYTTCQATIFPDTLSETFSGVAARRLAATVLWVQDRSDKPETQNTKPVVNQRSQSDNAAQVQSNKDLYDQCINNANRLYDEYVAKAPADLSVQEHLMYTQSMAQTRDSQKSDCDRRFSQNAY